MKKIDLAELGLAPNQQVPALPAPDSSFPVPTAAANNERASVAIKMERRGELSPILSYVLQECQRELGLDSDVDHKIGGIGRYSGDRVALVDSVADRLGFSLSHFERDQVLAQIEAGQKPFGILQELVDDPSISDIIVANYSKITVQQGRLNHSTGLSFPSQDAYEAFVERLLQRAGSTYSTKKPIADGMIGAHARIHVVHRSICDSGPYLTIRLNRFASISISDLAERGSAPGPVLDYLRALVRTGQTILVVGEVGTGKTTVTRALAACIPSDESLLVIEDTPEIRLEHPHVRYIRTREQNTDGVGRITPQECIRGGMRMAMNRIIFGEIRDAEAAEAFVDVCASGHPGISTIHARSAAEAITRLELFLGRAQKGVGRAVLNEQIVTAVQAIVFVDFCKVTKARRIIDVREIGPVADGVIRHREIFKYQVQNGNPTWKTLTRVSAHRELIESEPNRIMLGSYPAVLTLGRATSADLH